ncbi:MAG: hypothetical protein BWY70_01866 [Bacteroidetes bacterium ADurb.Bin408]|nr:MAG: hypothetical protein BWY70_01866 [Bacteroidetes bacterium ADurb.Bin408]
MFNFFIQGLLYVGPITVVLYIIFKLFLFIDGIIPFEIPGLGFVVILFSITFIGFIGKTIITRPTIGYFAKLIERIPLIKTVYESVKDLLSAFVGNKKKFNVPVLVNLSTGTETYKLGFLTRDNLSELGIERKMVAVYLPYSYTFSGNMFIVPAKNVTVLNLSSAEVMKFIVSAGVIDIDEVRPSEKHNGTESETPLVAPK